MCSKDGTAITIIQAVSLEYCYVRQHISYNHFLSRAKIWATL